MQNVNPSLPPPHVYKSIHLIHQIIFIKPLFFSNLVFFQKFVHCFLFLPLFRCTSFCQNINLQEFLAKVILLGGFEHETQTIN